MLRRTIALGLLVGAMTVGVLFGVTAALVLAAEDKIDLQVGQPAPKVEATDDTGKSWKAADHYGKKIVVLFFYPAAMTGGCTKQACGFRDDLQKLADKGVEVVGVSGDEVSGLQLFKKAHKLNFTLLADTDGSIAKQFGVPLGKGGEITRDVDGEKHVLKRGVTAARWTFVIDKEAKIALKNTKVNAAEDSKAIAKFVERLRGDASKPEK